MERKMAFNSYMPNKKKTELAMSEQLSSRHSRQGLKFPPAAKDTGSNGSRRQPLVVDHNLRAVKVEAPVDREHGKKRPSGAANMTEIPVQSPINSSPRHDRGRSTGRTTERRGSVVRSSSCGSPYSSKDDTKTASLSHPLHDVMDALPEGLRSKLSNYMESHEKLKTEHDCLKSQVSLYKLKLRTTKNLDERLSSLMASNERSLENVSEKIRPSTLAERFREIESTEWLKAKETMDMRFGRGEDDQTTFHLLCSTITVAFHVARKQIQKLYRHQNNILRGSLRSEEPVIAKAHSQTKSVEEEEADQLPEALRNVLTKRWRSDAEKCSIEQLEKKTMSNLSTAYMWQIQEIGGDHVFGQYLSACCRLAWQMNIMQPPMYISVEGGCYNERNHRVWYTCEKSPNARIRFYVWPSLYDCRGGTLLQPGLVYLDRSQRTEQHKTHMRGGIVAMPSLDNRRR